MVLSAGKINRPSQDASGDCLCLPRLSFFAALSLSPDARLIIIIIYNKNNLGKHNGEIPVNFQHYTREKVSMEGKVV
jgi:hypothetical protein